MPTCLPNPFAEVKPSSADSAVASSPQPPGDATASYFESPMTMEDIKARPAVPQTSVGATDFNSPLEPAMAGDAAAGPGLTDDPDPAAARFALDVDRFCEAIEPLPLFLQAPVDALRILARHG